MGVSMIAGSGCADARASPQSTEMAKICFSPSESRSLESACPASLKSVIANDAGSMWIRSTKVCLRNR